ncbi:Serine/threonine protein phosphatase 2A 55 kDa regulatory subunit B beta isoform [Hondaea fermentalgiana]|uniref:Serine/threonine-protein phosphatase 2A 55 kDa regulatory subunit B n=1 Tax=Hondaea fermentalgiana TaxID=2315210 RepID=A0A2R5GIK6_9STRA|nr:Serine/threonine protein phosphatase 2A 55 kDa regulatory subunit B beta isoform [Hondaea fermentalgiana]|eukprot:GBG30149.1 Serine/threonine protein phosphatase 2A 55 kDa regulatory subunit B beta isoform [Hondaea fermentalgiana]
MEEDDDWKFSQCFGEKTALEDLNEADIISAVEFDQSGAFLATGDKGGRVVVFELDGHNAVQGIAAATSKKRRPLKAPLEFRFQSEFQSHEPEFDYLKSLEIEEKINRIRWCRPANNALFLLSTNDKTIKLWKVHEKTIKTVCNLNVDEDTKAATAAARRARVVSGSGAHAKQPLQARGPHEDEMMDIVEESGKEPDVPLFQRRQVPRLVVPKLKYASRCMSSTARRVYSNAHAYHINSVSVNSDGATFISADDLRINYWNLDLNDQSYNIVDIKPENMEELAEVITAAEFHPTQCNLFMYSSSRGSIRLGDMRARALCDIQAKTFEEPEVPGNKSFFSEIIASLSDIKFTNDGRYIISRDYLTVKVWDVNMENKPVKTIPIHDQLRSQLSELYESECIFDKFEVAVSPDGNGFATGSYSSQFHILDRSGKSSLCIEAGKMPPKQAMSFRSQGIDFSPAMEVCSESFDKPDGAMDYNRKAMHMSWHPQVPLLAVAGLNNLFIYSR